jgi:hypothetical protein
MLWVGVSTVSFKSFAEMILKHTPNLFTQPLIDVDRLPPVS